MDYETLNKIVASNSLHAKWLNTLSYLENCGARKIAAYEHPTMVKSEVLKHAYEEFRHAYYLKQQMKKLNVEFIHDYRDKLGGILTKNYLDLLEVAVSRLLRDNFHWDRSKILKYGYICVTYAIEIRAALLYPLYQQVLKELQSSVSMKMLILEEDQHLAEMEKELTQIGEKHLKENLIAIEDKIYRKWINHLVETLHKYL